MNRVSKLVKYGFRKQPYLVAGPSSRLVPEEGNRAVDWFCSSRLVPKEGTKAVDWLG